MANLFSTKRITVYASKIERGNNGVDPSWRGYCWGSDFPRINFHRGTTCNCLDLSWLCYFVSIYWNKPTTNPANSENNEV